MNWGVRKVVRWFLWSIILVLGRLPFRTRSKLGSALGFLASLIPARDRTIARMQIRCFLRSKDSVKIVRGVYSSFGQTFLECINLKPLIDKPEDFIDFPSWPEAELRLSQKRGIIALTAHLGNWDAMGAYFANKQVPLLAVAKQTRNPDYQFLLEKLRASFGFRTLWRSSKKSISDILSALKCGQVVAVLIDQDTRVSSLRVPFFGTTVSTPSTIIEIGKKADSLFATAFVVRKDSGRFEIIVKEIPADLSTQEILAEYNKRLEDIVREYPQQWAWIHKRWRTLDSGERLGGKEYLTYLIDLEKTIQQESNVPAPD